MNQDYKIYHADEGNISAEDKLRLEAYLRGREDEQREEMLREMERKIEKLESQ